MRLINGQLPPCHESVAQFIEANPEERLARAAANFDILEASVRRIRENMRNIGRIASSHRRA